MFCDLLRFVCSARISGDRKMNQILNCSMALALTIGAGQALAAPAQEAPKAEAANSTTEQAGMKAYVDPETGQLVSRPTTQADAAALDSAFKEECTHVFRERQPVAGFNVHGNGQFVGSQVDEPLSIPGQCPPRSYCLSIGSIAGTMPGGSGAYAGCECRLGRKPAAWTRSGMAGRRGNIPCDRTDRARNFTVTGTMEECCPATSGRRAV